ncbi:MAG: hypothetical protein KF713_11215 [Turneriella sp.]|nr:hypothetical protein [Turneriella sp.]
MEALAILANANPRLKFSGLHDLLLDFFNQEAAIRKARRKGVLAQISSAMRKRKNRLALAAALSPRLKQLNFQPEPYKRIEQVTGAKLRPLNLSEFPEKVVQTMIATILSALWEPLWTDHLYSYRGGKYGDSEKARKLFRELARDTQYGYLVKIDIENYFENILQEELIQILRERIADEKFLSLIEEFLNAGYLKELPSNTLETEYVEQNGIGLPQGISIAPVLSNIYGHEVFDKWFYAQGFSKFGKVIRSSDDIAAFFTSQAMAEKFVKKVQKRFKKYGLSLHPEKTRIFDLTDLKNHPQQPDFLGQTHFITLHDDSVRNNPKHRSKRKIWSIISEKRRESKIEEFKEWLLEERTRKYTNFERTETFLIKIAGTCNYYYRREGREIIAALLLEQFELFLNEYGWQMLDPIAAQLEIDFTVILSGYMSRAQKNPVFLNNLHSAAGRGRILLGKDKGKDPKESRKSNNKPMNIRKRSVKSIVGGIRAGIGYATHFLYSLPLYTSLTPPKSNPGPVWAGMPRVFHWLRSRVGLMVVYLEMAKKLISLQVLKIGLNYSRPFVSTWHPRLIVAPKEVPVRLSRPHRMLI